MKKFHVEYTIGDGKSPLKHKKGIIEAEEKDKVKYWLNRRYNPNGWKEYGIRIQSIEEETISETL